MIMNRIYKTLIALSALAVVTSCYKEPEFEFAQTGPDLTVTCDESALMGGEIDFVADIYDDSYPLSVLKVELYWDLELGEAVSEVELRAKTEGSHLGTLPVPFEKDLNDGIAAVVFKAVNTHLGETCDTAYVAISRPDFETLTLRSGSWNRTMSKVEGEAYGYSYTGTIPSAFEPYIITPEIDGSGTELTFGWNGMEIVLNGNMPIPFDVLGSGTITFNTKTFEGTPFVDIKVNGQQADPASNGTYKAVASVKKGDKIGVTGVEGWPESWYVDPDHFTVKDGEIYFNAVEGFYSFELNTEYNFVTVRRVKADGSPATYDAEGAITFMGWGVAHPVMTNQIGWENGLYLTLAEIEDGVFQFSGKAVEETDGTTLGGAWRYDYLSFKFFGQAGWGAEYGTVTLTEEAKKYIAAPGNIELATGVNLELGAEYVMTVTDCSELDADNKFNCTIDFRKK